MSSIKKFFIENAVPLVLTTTMAGFIGQAWFQPDKPNILGKIFLGAANLPLKGDDVNFMRSYADFQFKRYSKDPDLYKKALKDYYGIPFDASQTQIRDRLVAGRIKESNDHTNAAIFMTFSSQYYGEKRWIYADIQNFAYEEKFLHIRKPAPVQ